MQHVVFGSGNPDYQVGYTAQTAAYQCNQEYYPDNRRVDVEIFGESAAHAGDTAVGCAAGQFSV